MNTPPPIPTKKPSAWLRFLPWILGVCGTPIIALWILLSWSWFHPSDYYPISGPSGPKNRAFIADIGGFGICDLLVSASDWPYTFTKPYVLGDIFGNEKLYASTGAYWSRDGSVIALRFKPHGKGEEFFDAAYDFQRHHALSHCNEQISELIQARGGLGPRSNTYQEVNSSIIMN